MRRNDTRGKAFVPQTTSESVSRRIFGSYPLAPEGLPAVNGKNQDTETSMRAAFMRKPVQPATSCIYSRLVRPRPARVTSANMDPAPTRRMGMDMECGMETPIRHGRLMHRVTHLGGARLPRQLQRPEIGSGTTCRCYSWTACGRIWRQLVLHLGAFTGSS